MSELGDWSDPERVAEYLARELPYRDVAEQLLLDALPTHVERVLDLGTGDGRLLALVSGRHPSARGVGIDSSQSMLERARARFVDDRAIELLAHDLALPLSVRAPFDAVLSGLAIHHLDDARKRALFGEVRELLAPGGVFANLDLVTSPSQRDHERFRQAIGRVQDDPSDQLATLGEQLTWLDEVGFERVDCRFKWMELALIVAVCPERDLQAGGPAGP